MVCSSRVKLWHFQLLALFGLVFIVVLNINNINTAAAASRFLSCHFGFHHQYTVKTWPRLSVVMICMSTLNPARTAGRCKRNLHWFSNYLINNFPFYHEIQFINYSFIQYLIFLLNRKFDLKYISIILTCNVIIIRKICL